MTRERLPGIGDPPLPASPHASHRALDAFDASAQAWDEYTSTPLGRLRQELTMHHLVQYLGSPVGSLNVLDVGGGTGSYAFPLARQGHRVCLLDFSAQMLAIARGKAQQLVPPLRKRIDFCHASIVEIPALFSSDHFDLVLCHALLEYVADPGDALCVLAAVLRPGGLLSLLFANMHAGPLHWAIARGDLQKARRALDEPISTADLFGLARRTFTAETMQEAMAQVGLEVVARYGVRVFADYVAAEKLADPESFARMLELEIAAGSLDPYRQIARYNQLLGRKLET
jgi:ubiquinone/menaquinone biosynthesis C-methylase UbiE